MFNLIHHSPTTTPCNGVMIVFKGGTLPPLSTVVDWSLYQHVNGAPIDPSAVAQCDNCGLPIDMYVLLDPVTFAPYWVPITPPTFAWIAAHYPTLLAMYKVDHGDTKAAPISP